MLAALPGRVPRFQTRMLGDGIGSGAPLLNDWPLRTVHVQVLAHTPTRLLFALESLASDHKYLRICDLCKELGIACLHAHIAAERERQAKTDAGLVPLCPLASMVPVFWR